MEETITTSQKTGSAETETRSVPIERDWIAAAREMLIEGGVAAVRINPLAARLQVTRGGFYWRFKNREELLEHLLSDWETTNTRSIVRAVRRAGSPRERYRRLVRLWVDEKEFDPALDTAVRQWGNVDAKVAALVHAADDERIKAIRSLFEDAGQDETEAFVRARIIYFHQIGYYALGMRETKEERQLFLPMYTRILADLD